VTAARWCQCGHRKAHRPDLPPVKVLLAAVDPLGMPVATEVVPGQGADDPSSIPAITRVREGLGQRGRLDGATARGAPWRPGLVCKRVGDAALCPLSALQVPPPVLADELAADGRGLAGW
jgi:hypothetical protein